MDFMNEIKERIERRDFYREEKNKHESELELFLVYDKLEREAQQWLDVSVDLGIPALMTREQYYNYQSEKKEETPKIDLSSLIDIDIDERNILYTRRLKVDKIKDLDDVKRVLEFLNITVTTGNGLVEEGYDKVKDLFE